jgi:imidazolonepropionase-like amidohydrolase
MALRIRGIALPDETERELTIVDGMLREEASRDAEPVVEGGWLLPGLVDVHTHPGAEQPGDAFDESTFRRHVAAHRDAGVLTLRCPGLVRRLPAHLRQESFPRLITAGRWLAAPGGFFDGWGREVPIAALPQAAVEEASASDGWCKVVVDWSRTVDGARRYEPTVPPDVVEEIVHRVHAAGGRVAVHTQHERGAEAAVGAYADSIEHGMHLPERLLTEMAERRIALVPTLHAFSDIPSFVARKLDADAVSDHMLHGWERHPALVRTAWEAGVRVLAGTDALPHGNVVAEIEQLIAAGLPAHAAIGAASWDARRYLGLPGLEEGAPADVVAYAEDPRIAPEILRHPQRVVIAGCVIA